MLKQTAFSSAALGSSNVVTSKRNPAWLALICIAALIGVVFAPVSAHAQDRIIFDRGHVDAFNVFYQDGKLQLDLKEDVTGQHVHRDPESVELHVKDASYMQIPAPAPGSPAGYYLPQTENQNLLWPGWDTLGTQESGFQPAIKLHFLEVSGPGTIHLFGSGNFGGVTPLLENGSTTLESGAVRNQAFPAHTHANWVFSAPGIYTIKMQASGNIGGTELTSNEATYTFTVGDAFKGATNQYAPSESDSTTPGTTQPAPIQPAPVTSAPMEPATPAPTAPTVTTPEVADATASATADTTAPDSAPAVPVPAAPAPAAPPTCTATRESRPATQAEVNAATAPVASAGGSYTVPANTHTHPNWVFSQPGNYQVSIRQTVTLKSGQKVSGDSTLNFTVGNGASGINNGHFDFGAMMEGNQLIPSIKDDRQSPAKWVNPSSFNFALGSAAKATAPAGIEFVAPAGSTVWMIPGAQIPGVPWLGANTMHPSIIEKTTGEMTYTLLGVNGPGNVGVFTSGNFGQVVGAKWFASTSGAASATKIAESEEAAQPGQIFKDAEGYKVLELVGRTESGELCELTQEQIIAAGGSAEYANALTGGGRDALAATGVNAATPLFAAVLFMLSGATVLVRKAANG